MSVALGADFDPFAEDPYPFYARVRQQEPIMFRQDLDFWLVTRYEDIQSILLQPETFSARDTFNIFNKALSYGVTFYPRTIEELSKGYPVVPGALNSDGEEHVRLRDLLIKLFSPARVKALEPFMHEIANSLVNTFIEDQRAEMMNQFAYPFAGEVIQKLLGMPRQDIEQTRKWVQDWYTLNMVQVDEERQVAYAQSTVALQYYLAGLLADRRTDPQDDVISDLALLGASGKGWLTEAELVYQLLGFIIPGHTNPANLIGNGLHLLLEQPERWWTLCDHPENLPQTIEEIVRFDGPVRAFGRITTREVTLGGVTLPENAPLLLLFGSGNRDETVFAHAEEFVIPRNSNPHLGFGLGIHSCVATALSRLEGRVAFEVLSQRLPDLRLVPGQRLTHTPTLNFRGYQRLEVQWE
jgi:cytochrome P450